MLNFALSAVLTSCLIISFRTFQIFRINSFQAVVYNYWVCVFTGVITFGNLNEILRLNVREPWVWQSMSLGGLFISVFYLMAVTTHRVGVTITTVVNKTSLLIPVCFSLFVFGTASKQFDLINYGGLILAVCAIVLSSYKKANTDTPANSSLIVSMILPLWVFVGSGLVDLAASYLSWQYITPERSAVFPILAFGGAGSIGLIILVFQSVHARKLPSLKSAFGGTYLGIPNFFSFYFLILALQDFKQDGALLFPLLNIAVILISALVAWVLFKEKLSALNRVGMLLAIIAIVAVAYQEIWASVVK
jgi:drug/metabolite transporter (DMT)-like permease